MNIILNFSDTEVTLYPPGRYFLPLWSLAFVWLHHLAVIPSLHISSYLLILLSSNSKLPMAPLPTTGPSQARLRLILLLEFPPPLLPSPAPGLCAHSSILTSFISLPHSAPNTLLVSLCYLLHSNRLGSVPPTLD